MDQFDDELPEQAKEIPVIRSCDIPKVFQSEGEEKLFTSCTMCNRDLFADGVPYMIEKAFTRNLKYNITDTIFEYAICMPCYMKMASKLSDESKKKIQAYVDERLQPMERMKSFYDVEDFNPDSWLNNCMFTHAEKDSLSEYQIMGQFIGDQMLFTELPAMISFTAADEMMALMSKQTKDELDDFTNQFLGLPPELKALFPNRTPVMM